MTSIKFWAMKKMKFWVAAAAVFAALAVQGQGWMKIYGENEPLGAVSLSNYPKLIRTADNQYLMMGFHYAQDGFTPDSAVLLKINEDGDLLWRKSMQHLSHWYPSDIVLAQDGGFVATGQDGSTNGPIFLAKFDETGEKLWEQSYDPPNSPDGQLSNAITVAPDGGYLIVGNVTTGIEVPGLALKVDVSGNLQWANTYTPFGVGSDHFYDVEPVGDGGYVVSGYHYNLSPQVGRALLLKIDGNGNTSWYNDGTNPQGGYADKVIPLPDGTFVIAGHNIGQYSSSGDKIWVESLDFYLTNMVRTEEGEFLLSGGINSSDVLLQKLSNTGQVVWTKNYGSPLNQEKAGGLLLNLDGTVVISGHRFDAEGNKAGLLLLKTDANGNIYSSVITGNIHHDAETDCQPDPAEPGLSNWLVQATGNPSFATLTDSLGNFLLPLDTGSYEVTLTPPSPYWGVCNSPVNVEVTAFYDTTELDFPVQAILECPYLEVSITAPFLRRCFDNAYYVQYCNYGTADAPNAFLEVTLDPYLSYVSSSIPLASQSGNTLSFDLGNVGVNDCGSFQITAYLDCDSTVLGQTHCTEAHIFPDSLCLPVNPLWDGSSIETNVFCNGDSITFIITNTGTGEMATPLNYIIIEDEIVLMTNEFQLGTGQSATISLPANGTTLHLEAQQSPEHPEGIASTGATIEGCGGWLSLGFFNQFSTPDASPFVDIDCQPNVGSYDPNDKLAFPAGFTEEHLIEPQEDIEYLIRFQNTGTDTAFKVVVVDVLPQELDLATVRPGVSSHPYAYSVTPEGWLIFTFENIQLPDSTSNEPGSHGFLRFRVSQRAGNGIGDVIRNTALIYFDFNAAVQTNTYVHRVGKIYPWSVVGAPGIPKPAVRMVVMPNPLTDRALVKVEGMNPLELKMILTDAFGRVIRVLEGGSEGFVIERNELRQGIYFFRIEKNGASVTGGKLMIGN